MIFLWSLYVEPLKSSKYSSGRGKKKDILGRYAL